MQLPPDVREEAFRITDAQLADVATMVRTGNTQAFAALAKGVRKRRVVEAQPGDGPPVPARAVYFFDFIVAELAELLDRADMNSLLLSAAYMRESKRAFFCWRLNPAYSHKYYNSTADARGSHNYEGPSGEKRLFADVLNARLRDTRTQLCLTLAKGPRDTGDRSVRKRRDNTIDLAYLENLHALALQQVNVVGSMSHLTTLREFVLLFPNYDCKISVKMAEALDMRHLGGCLSVRIRGTYSTQLPNANFCHLQSCRLLWLEEIGTINPAHIAGLPNLRRLFLHDCRGVDYARLDRRVGLYLSGVPIYEDLGLGGLRELHVAVQGSSDMHGLAHLAGVEDLYMMPKRGKRTLVKEFRKLFPRTRAWLDDGTWAENMYY